MNRFNLNETFLFANRFQTHNKKMGNKTDKNQENLTYLNNTIISDFVLIESSLFRLEHILNEARKTVISKHLQVSFVFILNK